MRSIPSDPLRIVFMGTPEFGVPTLRRICSGGDHVVAVVTQPDRARGRRKTPEPPPVKTAATELGIPVIQPGRLNEPEFTAHLRDLSPQVIVVVAYGKILPPWILELPSHGCLNVHASLLPRYRGAAPINWAIIRGESVTGVTIIQMDEGMDTGDMLLKREVSIGPEETAGELFVRLEGTGADALAEALEQVRSGTIDPVPQDHGQATLAPMLSKDDGRILWQSSAAKIHDFVRGMNPWPGAFTNVGTKTLKVHRCRVVGPGTSIPSGAGPGEVIGAVTDPAVDTAAGIGVVTGEGLLLLTEIQLQDRKRMAASEFVKGFRIQERVTLGEAL